MEVKKYIMMTVTLIIGVVLVAGVLTPVIADSIDNGSDTGSSGVETDITGYDRYAKADASTNLTIWIDYESYSYYCYSDPRLDPDVEKIPIDWILFIGDTWFIEGSYVSDGNENYEWDCYASPITISGTSVTYEGMDSTGHSVGMITQTNLMYYPDPDGEYICPSKYDDTADEYVFLPIYADIQDIVLTVHFSDDSQYGLSLCSLLVYGSVSDYTTAVISYNDNVIESCVWSGYDIADGVVVGGTAVLEGIEIPVVFDDVVSVSDISAEGIVCIVPISAYSGGSSGGSSISSTLASLLTVVPILVLAGLVIMTVMMFRRL